MVCSAFTSPQSSSEESSVIHPPLMNSVTPFLKAQRSSTESVRRGLRHNLTPTTHASTHQHVFIFTCGRSVGAYCTQRQGMPTGVSIGKQRKRKKWGSLCREGEELGLRQWGRLFGCGGEAACAFSDQQGGGSENCGK